MKKLTKIELWKLNGGLKGTWLKIVVWIKCIFNPKVTPYDRGYSKGLEDARNSEE
jgi:hypothetical protein